MDFLFYFLFKLIIQSTYLSETLDTESILFAVKQGIEKYGVPAIINSDQGSQFTSIATKVF